MDTVNEWVRHCYGTLKVNHIALPKYSAEVLLAHVIGIPKHLDIYLYPERILTNDQKLSLHALLKRRLMHEPLEYLVGYADFHQIRVQLSQDVLIPRPETEELVEKVIRQLKGKDLKNKTLWDLCTGSGCIAIAIKKALPDLQVIASDICPKALEVAKKNAEMNGVEITFYQADFLNAYQGTWDYLVCNPPYISKNEYETLDASLSYEPKQALLAERNGLAFYENLAVKEAKRGKWLFLELGQTQAEAVKNLFIEKLKLTGQILLDLSGKKRFFFLEFE